jgi:phosphoribosyl 1,2-cyclic phosphodiesterase
MEKLGLDSDAVEAVAFTHEHSDHIGALPVLLRRTDWAFLLTPETKIAVEACLQIQIPAHRWVPLKAGRTLVWQGWTLHPFSLPHDAADPVAFRVERGGCTAAVVTDLGHPSALVADCCSDLDLLVLEANHDVEMLREGDYPPLLKARILSRVGHLSNAAMAELLERVLSPRLADVVLAHLSESNNHPELARLAAEEVLKGSPVRLHLAHQQEPMGLLAASH